MKIYEYPKWTTCKKAKKFLAEDNINAEFIDITKQTPSEEELKELLEHFPLKKLFNTSGNKYKELNLKEKFDKLSIDEAIKLLTSDGMLIKRPVLIDDKNKIYLVGFKENEWEILKKYNG